MPGVTFVTSRALCQDGVLYIISVYRTNNGFSGFWECKACDKQDRTKANLPHRDDVINVCQIQINQHHLRHHVPVVQQ